MERMRVAGLLVLLGVSSPVRATEGEARKFIAEMIRGVGATRVACPTDVQQAALAREMGVVCASFDGDFEAFESRWRRKMQRDAPVGEGGGTGDFPRPRAHTGWELRGGIHERIYAVGRTALGIRFFHGDLTLVYK